ncbi:hypothetical protein ACOME3_002231 [Neoechinorhynchus agilis]
MGVSKNVQKCTAQCDWSVPAEMMMGRRLATKFDHIKPSFRSKHQPKGFSKGRGFTEGQPVWWNRSKNDRWEKGIVRRQTGPRSFVINHGDGVYRRIHGDYVRDRLTIEQLNRERDQNENEIIEEHEQQSIKHEQKPIERERQSIEHE